MSLLDLEVQAILVVTASACALPGVFLVLRRLALMSDAISHSILFGIVLAFFITRDLSSPLLIGGAALAGIVTVLLVEGLHRTRLVKEDAAIGLVFPVLFCIGVLLISGFLRGVHLDENCVLLGKPEFAPFNRLVIGGEATASAEHADHGHVMPTRGGIDLGPKSLWVMGIILIINLTFILLFYKELKLATFDASLAAALGFAPWLLHYGLMVLVSITAVGAFETVGSILVVALMIVPPATAYLLTDRLAWMIGFSALLAALCGVLGYWLAHPRMLDTCISGSMATVAGAMFSLVLLFAPQRGVLAVLRRRQQQRWDFAQLMLAIHLFNHEKTADAERENRIDHLQEHLNWDPRFARRVVRRAERRGLIRLEEEGMLRLTTPGRAAAEQALQLQ
ncbi:MAG: zinc ABC transporter permease [Gemmatales bacterium]|nr:MAG: zinc ABC transporter permease [Gemmatales bacterium]